MTGKNLHLQDDATLPSAAESDWTADDDFTIGKKRSTKQLQEENAAAFDSSTKPEWSGPEDVDEAEDIKEEETPATSASYGRWTNPTHPYASLSERELVARAQQGDNTAWRYLLYFPWNNRPCLLQRMNATAHRRLSDDWDGAEDCVAETLAEICKPGGIQKFRGDAKFSTWVLTILSRKIGNYINEKFAGDINLKELELEIRKNISPSDTAACMAIQAVLSSIEECIQKNKRSYDSKLPNHLKNLYEILHDDDNKQLIEKWLNKIKKKSTLTREVPASYFEDQSPEDDSARQLFNEVANTDLSNISEEMLRRVLDTIEQIIQNNFKKPEETRKIFHYILLSEMTQTEIAKRLGLSDSQVSETLTRLRKLTKEQLPDLHLFGFKDEK